MTPLLFRHPRQPGAAWIRARHAPHLIGPGERAIPDPRRGNADRVTAVEARRTACRRALRTQAGAQALRPLPRPITPEAGKRARRDIEPQGLAGDAAAALEHVEPKLSSRRRQSDAQ